MSMTDAMRRGFVAAGYVLLAFVLLGLFDVAFAQSASFGMRGGAPDTGLVGWILAKQSEFYRAMSVDIRAAKADGSAVVTLLGISFAYGIFHAAGPGHGKAVISSYIVANEETWRRGIVLSFASALLQALVAVVIVGIAVMLLGATRRGMDNTTRVIEIGSYALIVFLGARLLWTKSRGFLAAWRAQNRPTTLSAAAIAEHRHDHNHHHDCGHDHTHDHEHHTHDHDHAHDHHHDHAQDHFHGPDCGHAHGPEPSELAGPGGWRRGLSAIVAVGLRPCSGAILVLVFAAAQGLFWAGVAATFVMGLGTAITVAAIATMAVSARALAAKFAQSRPGAGGLFLRGVEVAAAALVLVFGLALLTGYMAAERMFGA